MNALSSECSSGCESGWTLYFDHSSSDDYDAAVRVEDGGDLKKPEFGKKVFEEEEEEEDLSMVSDASSGPPIHYEAADAADEEPRRSFRSAHTNTKRQKMIKRGGQEEDYQSLLDDTASSPAITNQCAWNGGVGIQKGRTSAYQQHYDEFLHSHISGHHHQQHQHQHHYDHDNNQWFGMKDMKKWI